VIGILNNGGLNIDRAKRQNFFDVLRNGELRMAANRARSVSLLFVTENSDDRSRGLTGRSTSSVRRPSPG